MRIAVKTLRDSAGFYSALGGPIWDTDYERIVREVIKAISEPTDTMRACGINAGWWFDGEDHEGLGCDAAENLWRCMIERALRE